MSRERNELKAGLFILISIGLIVGVLVTIRGGRMGPMQRRTVAFKLADDLGGLRVGDDVRIGGFKIGQIHDVQPADLQGGEPKILVTFSMPSRYVLREDATVGVQSALTGASNLNIQSLGTGKPLPDGAPITGVPDPKSALLAGLGRVSPQVEEVIAKVKTETLPKVNDAIGSYKQVADKGSRVMDQVNGLVTEARPDVRSTLAHLNELTNTINQKLPGIATQVSGLITKVDEVVVGAKSAMEDVQKTSANARDLTGGVRSLVIGNRGKFDSIIGSLKITSDNLKAASVEIRRTPWRLLYKPGPGEMANLNLYDSARQFSEGAGSLNDAATALRDALKDNQSDPKQIQKLVERLDQSFTNFHQMEDKLWVSVKE